MGGNPRGKGCKDKKKNDAFAFHVEAVFSFVPDALQQSESYGTEEGCSALYGGRKT